MTIWGGFENKIKVFRAILRLGKKNQARLPSFEDYIVEKDSCGLLTTIRWESNPRKRGSGDLSSYNLINKTG